MKLNVYLAGLAAVLALGILLSAGCASTSKQDLAYLQGSWVGHETGGPPGECRMTVSGDSMKFQGSREQEWYAARLKLCPGTYPKQADVFIEDCSVPKYAGKTAKTIYKLEGGMLTIAGDEPGDPSVPGGFDRTAAPHARFFMFTRQ